MQENFKGSFRAFFNFRKEVNQMAKIRRSPIGGFILSYENPHGQIQRSNIKMQSFQQICMHRLKKFAGIGQDTGHSGGYVSHSQYTSAGVYGSIGNRSAVGRNDAAAGVFRPNNAARLLNGQYAGFLNISQGRQRIMTKDITAQLCGLCGSHTGKPRGNGIKKQVGHLCRNGGKYG